MKVMREWTQLEEKYSQLSKSDPKGAETLKSELTEQFEVKSLRHIYEVHCIVII